MNGHVQTGGGGGLFLSLCLFFFFVVFFFFFFWGGFFFFPGRPSFLCGGRGRRRGGGGGVFVVFFGGGKDFVPEIISRDEARFVFPVSLATPHWLLFSAHPEGEAEYKIILRSGGASQQIAGRKITSAVSEKISLPAGEGELQFVVHGRIAWFDPRLVRKFFLWPVYLGAFIALTLALRNRPAPPATRASIGNWLALVASTFVCLGLIEFVLRRVALKLPPRC